MLCGNQFATIAYGAKLIGYLTALRNLQIRAAVCSTSSSAVVGACKAELLTTRLVLRRCDQLKIYLELPAESPRNCIQGLQQSMWRLVAAAQRLSCVRGTVIRSKSTTLRRSLT